MLTKTSISAIRALTYLGLRASRQPISPRQMAEELGESPTYLAKVVRHLVKSGLLRAYRGVAGGVTLGRAVEQITLLSIVEACQGTILGDFCEEADDLAKTCAFHQAGAELHQAIVGVLSRWNVARLIKKPLSSPELAKKHIRCWLEPHPPARPRKTPARSGADGAISSKGRRPNKRRRTAE